MKENNTHMTYITRILFEFVCCTLYACTRKHYVHTCKYKQEVVAMVKEIKYEFFFSSTCCFFFFFFPSWWQWLSNQSCTSFRSPKNEGLFLPACQIVEIKAISFSNHWMEFLPNIVILTFCGKVQFCFKASLISAAVRPVCSGGQPGLPVSSLSPDGHFVRALSRCFSGSNQSLSHCPIMRWPETAGEMCVVLTHTAQLFWLCYIMLTLLSEDVGAQTEQFLLFFFGHSSLTMLLFFSPFLTSQIKFI